MGISAEDAATLFEQLREGLTSLAKSRIYRRVRTQDAIDEALANGRENFVRDAARGRIPVGAEISALTNHVRWAAGKEGARRWAALQLESAMKNAIVLAPTAPTPEEHLRTKQTLQRVLDAFDTLSLVDQNIVRWYAVDDLTFREISEQLGCAPTTVMRRLRSATRFLASAA